MFVAQRQLRDSVNGVPVVYQPGDAIPNFESWDIHARRAHLSMEWVKRVAGPGESPDPADQKVFTVTTVEEEKPLPVAPEDVPAVASPTCSTCSRTFKSPRALNTHVALAHKK